MCDPRGTTSSCVKEIDKSTRPFRGRDTICPLSEGSRMARLKREYDLRNHLACGFVSSSTPTQRLAIGSGPPPT